MKTIFFLFCAAVFWFAFAYYCAVVTYNHYMIESWGNMVIAGLCGICSILNLYFIVCMGIVFEVKQLWKDT